ncbi:MAG: GNAT family N-acetyltransferase [Bacteroidota bacterium]
MQQLNQFQFVKANKDEMQDLSNLAREIWPITFKEILTVEQIDYMLNWMYNPETLSEQSDNGHEFYFLKHEKTKIGFVGIQNNYPEIGLLRIHKIYLKPTFHGKGLGKFMLEKIEERARMNDLRGLHLNVNRYNSVYNFYTYLGFDTLKKEDIDIGNGYLMEDYVMQKLF